MRVSRKVKIRKKSKTLRRKFVKSKQIQENKSKKSEESEREMRVSSCGGHAVSAEGGQSSCSNPVKLRLKKKEKTMTTRPSALGMSDPVMESLEILGTPDFSNL